LLGLAGALRGAAGPWTGRSPPVRKPWFQSSFGLMVTGAGSQRKETAVSVAGPLPDRPNVTSLRKQAKSLLAAWRAGNQQALARVRDLHPRGERVIATGRPALADAQLVVARGYGFADWAAVAAGRGQPVDARFEAAAGAIVSGDQDTLRALLDTDPALARARSPFGHHATLVHYVAANGVESSRQWQSPRNAVQILRILLRHGADRVPRRRGRARSLRHPGGQPRIRRRSG
jgi:hypothetical protein